MPRSLRVQYAGARYHLMCRGNRGARVFAEARDKEIYLDTLGETVERTGWRIHAWVLMRTHYHLLIETPEPNLVDGMKWFQGTFTQRHNGYHGHWGHLFQGRYKAKIIDDEHPEYFQRVADYIHLNPAAAGLLNREQPELKQYPWSSFLDYLKPPARRPGWLRVERVLGCHRVGGDTVKGRRAFEADMNLAMWEVVRNKGKAKWKRQWARYERGWLHGSEAFRERMLQHLQEPGGGLPRPLYDGEQRRSYLEAAAKDWLAKGLETLGLERSELEELPKGDERKLLLGGWLKTHFSVTNRWLSGELHMGHPSRVSRAAGFYRAPPRRWRRDRQDLEKMLNFTG